MSSREVVYKNDLICDCCGAKGAYDLKGDNLCQRCVNGPDKYVSQIPKNWNQAAAIIANEIVQTIVKRQHDYGTGNILGFREKGIVVRIWDKVNRLKNLVWGDKEAKGERVEDTFVDLAGYSIIALMLRRGWFELPLRDQSTEKLTPKGSNHCSEVQG